MSRLRHSTVCFQSLEGLRLWPCTPLCIFVLFPVCGDVCLGFQLPVSFLRSFCVFSVVAAWEEGMPESVSFRAWEGRERACSSRRFPHPFGRDASWLALCCSGCCSLSPSCVLPGALRSVCPQCLWDSEDLKLPGLCLADVAGFFLSVISFENEWWCWEESGVHSALESGGRWPRLSFRRTLHVPSSPPFPSLHVSRGMASCARG